MNSTKYLLTTTLALALGVLSGQHEGTAHADGHRAPPSSLVQADLGLAILGIGYERVLSPRFSVRVTGQYNRPWYTESDLHSAALEVRPFYFPLGRGPGGLYLSPYARVAFVRAQDGAAEPVTGPGWTAGATVGYGFRLPKRMLLRLGGGFQYWAYRLPAEPEDAGLGGPHIALDLMFAVGF